MTDWPPIEFARWETPIENDELHLVDLVYGDGSWSTEDRAGQRFEVPPVRPIFGGLIATFFSVEKRALFEIRSPDTFTFRMLDEHGLVDLWAASNARARPGRATFRVRHHGWHRESELSFVMSSAEYSFVIATNWACLEIVVGQQPEIALVREVPALPA